MDIPHSVCSITLSIIFWFSIVLPAIISTPICYLSIIVFTHLDFYWFEVYQINLRFSTLPQIFIYYHNRCFNRVFTSPYRIL